MKPENCPGRLNLIVCVIVYRHQADGSKEFLMIQRDDGKFALIGGMGACCLSETMYEFAKREFDFDMDTDVPIKELEYVESTLDSEGKTLTLFFCYRYKSHSGQKMIGQWFSVEAINELAQNGKIEFDSDKPIARFAIRPMFLGKPL